MPETVSILREGTVLLPVAPGVSKSMTAITYAAEGMPPRIVYVDPDHDSEAERKRVISEDIKAARAAKTPTLELT